MGKISNMKGCGAPHNLRARWDMEARWPQYSPEETELLQEIERRAASNGEDEVLMCGVRVPIFPDFAPAITYALLNDAYEHGDVALLRRYLTPSDRVSVIGAGIGVISTVAAQMTEARVLAWDANPRLEMNIRLIAFLNGVDVDFHHGAMGVGDDATEVNFTLSREFWSSSLNPDTYQAQEQITVPVFSLDQMLPADINVAFIDVEGAEVGLVFNALPSSIEKVFVEIHRPNIGGQDTARVMNALFVQGFTLVDMVGLTSFWRRS